MGRPVLYRGAVDCVQQILRAEGPRAFYRGMLCSYLKVCWLPSYWHIHSLFVACTGAREGVCARVRVRVWGP